MLLRLYFKHLYRDLASIPTLCNRRVFSIRPTGLALCVKAYCPMQLVHDETGRVWIMLHSGSRNIGNKTAMHYDKLAEELLTRQDIKVPSKLHYMEVESKEGQAYLQVQLPSL